MAHMVVEVSHLMHTKQCMALMVVEVSLSAQTKRCMVHKTVEVSNPMHVKQSMVHMTVEASQMYLAGPNICLRMLHSTITATGTSFKVTGLSLLAASGIADESIECHAGNAAITQLAGEGRVSVVVLAGRLCMW